MLDLNQANIILTTSPVANLNMKNVPRNESTMLFHSEPDGGLLCSDRHA